MLCCALLCAAGCASRTSRQPDPSLAGLWRDYQQLPGHRALAVAGSFRSDRWVAGMSGGHATPADAEQSALERCRAERVRRREQAMCRIYAVGDEIVWTGS
jgi:hypothetical protein